MQRRQIDPEAVAKAAGAGQWEAIQNLAFDPVNKRYVCPISTCKVTGGAKRARKANMVEHLRADHDMDEFVSHVLSGYVYCGDCKIHGVSTNNLVKRHKESMQKAGVRVREEEEGEEGSEEREGEEEEEGEEEGGEEAMSEAEQPSESAAAAAAKPVVSCPFTQLAVKSLKSSGKVPCFGNASGEVRCSQVFPNHRTAYQHVLQRHGQLNYLAPVAFTVHNQVVFDDFLAFLAHRSSPVVLVNSQSSKAFTPTGAVSARRIYKCCQSKETSRGKAPGAEGVPLAAAVTVIGVGVGFQEGERKTRRAIPVTSWHSAAPSV